MNICLSFLIYSLLTFSGSAIAADSAIVSPTSGLLRMLLGLLVVLALMAVLAWLLKRVLPGAGGQQSVVRIIGGVSVGSRERVVVVEVADRWLVVGVAPGQINAIANLDIGTVKFSEQMTEISPSVNNQLSPALNALTQPFSQWLKKSSGKFTEKKDV